MNILVTGSEGFIGKRLCERLQKAGHTVLCHDYIIGDIAKPDALESFDSAEFVYHLAAKTFVPQSWSDPHAYFKTNVLGTATVLEHCRKHNIPLALMSTYVYGAPQYLPVDEGHPVSAASPYHESKLLCESLAGFYTENYQLDITIFRPFNVYGHGQDRAFLLPKIMEQLLDKDKEAIELSDLSPRRDFVYVQDVVNALELALKPFKGLRVFNIGTGSSISVLEALETIMRVTEIHKPYRESGERRAGEISDCVADISEIRESLGFEPKFAFAEGIRAWLKDAQMISED